MDFNNGRNTVSSRKGFYNFLRPATAARALRAVWPQPMNTEKPRHMGDLPGRGEHFELYILREPAYHLCRVNGDGGYLDAALQ